jgi:hypothetical protein
MRKGRLKSTLRACAVLALGLAVFAAMKPSLCMAQQVIDSQVPHPLDPQPAPRAFVLRKTPAGSQWFRGRAITMTGAAITIRNPKNPRMIRTFTYSAEVEDQMQQHLDQGGYHFGDKVRVRFDSQNNEALAVNGKPSKSAP